MDSLMLEFHMALLSFEILISVIESKWVGSVKKFWTSIRTHTRTHTHTHKSFAWENFFPKLIAFNYYESTIVNLWYKDDQCDVVYICRRPKLTFTKNKKLTTKVLCF